MNAQDKVLGGSFCFVQQCTYCSGTGLQQLTHYSASSENGYYPPSTPQSVACGNCVRGFRFMAVKPEGVLEYLLETLAGPTGHRLRGKLLEALTQATEERMVPEVRYG